MKSFLSNTLFWGVAFILLQNGDATSQPIQLIPQKENEVIQQPQGEDELSFSQPSLEFWEGTPPSVIETYFPKLPLRLSSPLLRGLRAQIAKEPYTNLLRNTAYETAFLSLLTEGGEVEQAKEFLLEADLPEKDSLLLDLQWLAGDTKKACEKVANLIRSSAQVEWKKQNIYCLYLNGEEERAKIAAEVLNESNPAAAQLLNMLFNEGAQPPFHQSIAKFPFLLTMWLETKQNIPESELNKLSSSSLALIARSEKAPLHTRLLAGEKAVQQGTFTAEDFAALVKESPATEFWGEVAQALASAKTEVLLPLFERAAQQQKLGLLAQVFSSPLASLDPSLKTLPLAPFMVQAFLQSEKNELAKKWGTFFMREAPDEAIAVRPLLHIAFPENNWDQSQIQAWQAYERRLHPLTAPQHSYEMRRILGALGEPSGDPMKGEPAVPSWRQEKALFDGQEAPLLESAATSHRKGEVLLLALTLIGETPLADFSVDKLVPILKALERAGYKAESRSLALEFLLAKGS
ncbi:MAG: hypothetical protein H0X26_08485 [Alphaproteobacteria bacterium]|nr:hypothetical protein [Alphaproteobacteria bacterium]